MSTEEPKDKLQDMQAKLDADLVIDPSHLMSEVAGNITKHASYYHKLTAWKAKLKMAELDLLALVRNRYNFYAGKHDDPIYSYNLAAAGITKNVEGDSQVLDKMKANAMIQIKVDFYEKACKLFSDRGFAIQNMIAIVKFENGV